MRFPVLLTMASLGVLGCTHVVEESPPDAVANGGDMSTTGGFVGQGGEPQSSNGGGGAGPGGAPPASGVLTVLATGLNQPAYIALTAGEVYVTEQGSDESDGALVRLPKSGGALDRVVPEQQSPWAIEIANGSVYWSNYGTGDDGSLNRLSLADDSVDVLADDLFYPWDLSYFDGSVYWSDSNSQRVLAVRPDLTIDVLDDQILLPMPIVADATGVYVGFEGLPPAVEPIRRFAPNEPPTDLYDSIDRAMALFLDDDSLYFITGSGLVVRGTRDGASPVPLASLGGNVMGGALADGYVYFTMIYEGVVGRVPIQGGAVETLATGQQMPHGIAVDDEAVYWVNQSSGEVLRLTK